MSQDKFQSFVRFVRDLYNTKGSVPLHEPCFKGNEKNYVSECIDSTFVSNVGHFVDLLEKEVSAFTNANHAIATVNGTTALHTALKLVGVQEGDGVITQSLTFIATCNAIVYCQAKPIFIDIDKDTLGLSPHSLEVFLEEHCELREDGSCWYKKTNTIIRACLPMHSFGFPTKIDKIKELTKRYNIALVEDAAESLGSFYKGKHTGIIGDIGILSFNGNKIVTTGGGGMILTNNKEIANRAKHLTTNAKVDHLWEFYHDEIGFNYRLPNINAALGLSQMEQLEEFIKNKRKIAQSYQQWGKQHDIRFFHEPEGTKSNYWLNVVITKDKIERDEMLQYTNENGVMTRPVWSPMHKLPMFESCTKGDLTNTESFSEQIVNVPSSVNF